MLKWRLHFYIVILVCRALNIVIELVGLLINNIFSRICESILFCKWWFIILKLSATWVVVHIIIYFIIILPLIVSVMVNNITFIVIINSAPFITPFLCSLFSRTLHDILHSFLLLILLIKVLGISTSRTFVGQVGRYHLIMYWISRISS